MTEKSACQEAVTSPLLHFPMCSSFPASFPFSFVRASVGPHSPIKHEHIILCLMLCFLEAEANTSNSSKVSVKLVPVTGLEPQSLFPEFVFFFTTQSTPSKGKNKTLGYKVNAIFKNNLSLSDNYIAAASYLSPSLNLTFICSKLGAESFLHKLLTSFILSPS